MPEWFYRASTGMDSRLKHAGMTLKTPENLFDAVLSPLHQDIGKITAVLVSSLTT
jgi:hypothetical protein